MMNVLKRWISKNFILDKYKGREKIMNTTYEYMDRDSIDPELICSICHLPFTDPRHTLCGETFCYECITNWIQTQNASCPICQESLSVDVLTKASRMIRNMLNRLRIKCIVCGQADIQRGDFDDHIQKVCPTTVVFCPSADINCPWKGRRDQLKQHLEDCRFEPMRPVITQFIVENQQLKDRVNDQMNQITAQQNKIQQLEDLVNDQINQITAQQNEIQRLEDQVNQQTIETVRQQNENQQLTEQEVQLTTQINTYQRENQELKDQVNRQTIETVRQQNDSQQFKEQVTQLTAQINTYQRDNKELKDQVNQQITEIINQKYQIRELEEEVARKTKQVHTYQQDIQQLDKELKQKDVHVTYMSYKSRE
jgi:uncharacterized coiled-coil DUF342 family protein